SLERLLCFGHGFALVMLALLLGATGCREQQTSGRDPRESVEGSSAWMLAELRRKAEHGDAIAQFNLGHRQALGEGLPKNLSEAAKWLRKAATQGHAPAQYEIGMLLVNGHATPTESGEAVRWIRMAANQTHPGAEFVLGLVYDKGEFVPKDVVEAGKWI